MCEYHSCLYWILRISKLRLPHCLDMWKHFFKNWIYYKMRFFIIKTEVLEESNMLNYSWHIKLFEAQIVSSFPGSLPHFLFVTESQILSEHEDIAEHRTVCLSLLKLVMTKFLPVGVSKVLFDASGIFFRKRKCHATLLPLISSFSGL